MNEFELKFEIPAERLPQIVAAVHAKKAQLQILQACYFDDKDGALAKNGLVLRMRKEGNDWVQTAKGMTGNSLERLEHNVLIGASKTASSKSSNSMPVIDLARHADEKIGKLIMRALKIKPNGLMPALIPLYENDVQRLKFIEKHAGSLVEIALDQGMVISGGRSATLCELEIELKEGKPEHAIELARTWCASYGLWISTINKSMKGQRLHDLHLNQKHQVLEAKSELNSAANGKQMVKAVFQSCLNQILANASELASETGSEKASEKTKKIANETADTSQDAEYIHQLRVGIRRLRTAMRELTVLVDGINKAWEKPLIDAFRALGQHRDDGHLSHVLQPKIAAEGGPAVNTHITATKLLDASFVVRSKHFQDTLLCLIAYVNSSYLNEPNLNDAKHESDKPKQEYKHKKVSKILANRLDKLYEKIVKEGKKFLALTETQQHDVRKDFKRLRYLAEFSAPLFSTSALETKPALAFIKALKPVQDALGFYNDELMALQAYRTLVTKDKRAWFGAGWLSARRKSNAKKCQQEIDIFIKKTSKKKLFWQ